MVQSPSLIVAPAQELLDFAKRRVTLAAGRVPMDEKRLESRLPFVTPAVLQPLDNQAQGIGEPIAAVTRDVSQQGVGLIMESRPAHELFALQFFFEGKDIRLMVCIEWVRPLGPFEYVGCRALGVLESFPSAGKTL